MNANHLRITQLSAYQYSIPASKLHTTAWQTPPPIGGGGPLVIGGGEGNVEPTTPKNCQEVINSYKSKVK